MANAIREHPFPAMLEAVCHDKKRWDECINTLLDTWKISPRQLSEYIAGLNQAATGRPDTVSIHTIHVWKGEVETNNIAPISVATLTSAFKLSELQELMVWKSNNGRYLKEGEIEEAIEKAKASDPRHLVALLMESSGIQESRLMALVGVKQIKKWENGGYVKTPEVAGRLVDVTLGVERELLDEEARMHFDQKIRKEIVCSLTGRPLDLADIFSRNGSGPADAKDMMSALCGMYGLKTMEHSEFCELMQVGDKAGRELRQGRKLLSPEQAQKLLTHYGVGDEYKDRALALLATKPGQIHSR